jgi:hypothetical protein
MNEPPKQNVGRVEPAYRLLFKRVGDRVNLVFLVRGEPSVARSFEWTHHGRCCASDWIMQYVKDGTPLNRRAVEKLGEIGR